jgi:hypothetical protein
MSAGGDNDDEFDLRHPVNENIGSLGAAADSSATEDRLKNLPRILRYAMFAGRSGALERPRLIAEIDELCPQMRLNAAWTENADDGTSVALAHELDHRAVVQDQPELRSLADCVRLLSLPLPRDSSHIGDHHRVAKALLLALRNLSADTDPDILSEAEEFCFGWAALPAVVDLLPKLSAISAAAHAIRLGGTMARHRIAAAELAIREASRAEEEEQKAWQGRGKARSGDRPSEAPEVAGNHIVVARLDEDQIKNVRLKEILHPLKGVVNAALPLVHVPPLHLVRQQLLFEFPYAMDVVDSALADLVGRVTIKMGPLLMVGDPGGGKSRFARRLAEVLGLHIWRTDVSRCDGAAFAGTDRRWHSSEPCHPFLAIAQGKIANPLLLLDELEKAGTRSDYGRLWDCLLGFLEPETNRVTRTRRCK